MNIMNAADFLALYITSFQEGRAVLPAGQMEYKFTTRSTPKLVWIAENANGNMPVCQGGVNSFAVTPVSDGFILVADIQSEFTEILWQAVLEAPQTSNF